MDIKSILRQASTNSCSSLTRLLANSLLEIMFATDEQIKEIVEYLKIILNQESIAVQKEEITSELM